MLSYSIAGHRTALHSMFLISWPILWSMSERVIVLSDLHLSVAGAGGFEEDHALASFLAGLSAERVDTELVLAGDIFDLLLDPSYTEFSSELAVSRIDRILDNHVDVVNGLREFGARSGSSITWLSGNHDAEVLLPAVRERLRDALGLTSLGGEVVLSHDAPAPPVYGRAVGAQDAPIWIVHGDRWDPDNYIDRAALLEHRDITLPLGSRLVIDVLRELRSDYEWIYWLKPELESIIPLLVYLDPARTWKCLRDHSQLTIQLLTSQLRTMARMTDLFDAATSADESPPQWMLDLVQSVGDDPLDGLLADLGRALEHGHAPVYTNNLSGHNGLKKWLVRAWLSRVRERDRFQATDGPDVVRTRASGQIPSKVSVLVVGHTHGARCFDKPAYVNTGTWLPVVGIPEGTVEDVIDAIERGELRGQAPRSYAEITLGPTPRLALRRCDSDGRPIDFELP